MHIGINAQLLSYSQNYRNGGISRHIRSLLTGLAEWLGKDASGRENAEAEGLKRVRFAEAVGTGLKRAPQASLRPVGGEKGGYEFTVFVNGQEVVERLGAEHPQMCYVAVPWPESRPTCRVMWEQLTLPSLVRKLHIDVLHSPANVLPELLPGTCAGIVTLHDLAFLRYPDVLTRAKRLYHRSFTMRSLQRARMIITVSESTRQDAIKLAGVAAERVQTVYPCIDERFSNVIEEEEVASFRQERGLSGGFLLYLGTLEPRKNLVRLIEAYGRLRAEYGIGEKLVIAGGRGWLYDAILEKVQTLGLGSEVILPGYVADEERALWYHAASAFVYPSLYEGFGLPVAEALACGTPVVTSNVSSLPEVAREILRCAQDDNRAGGDNLAGGCPGGAGALTIDPGDVEAMAEAMYRALTDGALRQDCQAMAPVVAERFSAQAMVEQTVSVYERAARMRRPKD
jgi:glycosyltransferase involved in cell wall biosynthesis